jgi:hypothetical protein
MTRGLPDRTERRRNLLRRFRDLLQTTRRQLRRLLTSPRNLLAYARYRAALRCHDWIGLHAMLRPLSKAALHAKDTRWLVELGQAAMRLDEHQLGIELLHAARAGQVQPDDWRGEDIPDGTLVVRVTEKASQGVGPGLELSGYIRAAAARAARTIVIIERRLVPLFQRTLPEVRVLPFGADLGPHVHNEVRYTGTDELKYRLGYDARTVARLYMPLLADREQTQLVRERYRRGRSRPLIGISWWSSHYGKDLPSLRHWASLIDAVPAQFVSLQYGDVTDDVTTLSGGDPERVIVDSSVDQMTDMDRFASQIAALDLVITISNSGAHLAGALGQRMILVRDDLFRRNWPYLSRDVPWYPHASVIGKNERSWDVAFKEIIAKARLTTSPGVDPSP